MQIGKEITVDLRAAFFLKIISRPPEGEKKGYIDLRHTSVERDSISFHHEAPPPPIKTNENFSIEHASTKGETKV